MNVERTVLVCVVAAAGLHLAAQFAESGPGPQHLRTIIGAFLLAALLLLIAEFWPQGARGLALVILMTSVVMNGRGFANLVGSIADRKK